MIELREIGFRYPDAIEAAFEQLCLHVEAGRCAGLVGASGSGKTTLLHLLAGVAPTLTGGTAWGSGSIAGRSLPITGGDLADVVGCVNQDPGAGIVCERVEDEITFTAENLGIASPEIERRLNDLLERFGLHALRRRRISTLSGGERQKVQLAAALIADPSVLLFDEPTSQLDEASIDALVGALRALRGEGRTMLIAEQRPERIAGSLDDLIRLGAEPTASSQPVQRSVTPGEQLVAVEGLEITLGGARVLWDVSMRLHAGERIALTGANGSGKTTLLRALLGFIPHGSGRIVEVPARTGIAYVPQRPEAAFCRERVRDELALTMRARKLSGRIDDALEATGLAALADRSPRHLSAGQRLRVAIGALTLGSPQLVILDEPTRGLDADARVELIERIARWSAAGAVTLIATHDADLIAACDRTIELRDGTIVADVAVEVAR